MVSTPVVFARGIAKTFRTHNFAQVDFGSFDVPKREAAYFDSQASAAAALKVASCMGQSWLCNPSLTLDTLDTYGEMPGLNCRGSCVGSPNAATRYCRLIAIRGLISFQAERQ
jgi:hypothetical protein